MKVFEKLIHRGMGFQPMNHRQSLPRACRGDADATQAHGHDARATFYARSQAAF